MKKVFTIIFIVAALQLFVVSASYAAPSAWGNDGGGMYHTVRYGETLYSIGRMYGVHPNRIAEANGLYNPNYIYAGQVLYIPSGGGYYPPDGGHPGGNYHKVQYGETLYRIGRKYGVSPNCIAKANGLYNPNYIYAGQVLYIPSNCGGYGNQPGWGNQPMPCQYGNCYDNNWGNKPMPCQYGNCYDDVDSDWGVPRPEHPTYDNCQYHCGSSYYGYDYTGYYYVGYYPQQKQYSYTCGYYHNCW